MVGAYVRIFVRGVRRVRPRAASWDALGTQKDPPPGVGEGSRAVMCGCYSST